jgi:hypothetical protein
MLRWKQKLNNVLIWLKKQGNNTITAATFFKVALSL